MSIRSKVKPLCETMQRGNEMSGAVNGYLYTARLNTFRAYTDIHTTLYRPSLMLYFD